MRDSTESVSLPATAVDMFVAGTGLEFHPEKVRILSGQAFDYETFFDADLATKLVGIETTKTQDCRANRISTVTVTPAP